MPAGSRRTPLGRLRGAVETRVETTSLRQVAREVGMSPSGLQKFVHGAEPYSATRRKLERWYVREGARYGRGMDVGSAAGVLQALVQDLPPVDRPKALERALAALETSYRAARLPVPRWLQGVRELLERGELG